MRLTSPSIAVLLVLLTFRPLVQAAGGAFHIDPRALALVERSERVWRSARTATYRVLKTERMRDGRVITEELAVKYQSPGRVYARMLRPRVGQEIIYDRTKDKKHLTVHPGRFPDLTLSLDIEGSLATRDQHHTVAAVGFSKALQVLAAGIARAKREPNGESLEYGGKATFDGRSIEKVVMRAGSRPSARVTALPRETLLSFARRVGMDAHVILIANPAVRSLASGLDAGGSYLVPAYYAPRSESWFDERTGLPLRQVMWDKDGKLYEDYRHLDLALDRPLIDRDFDPTNPAYNF